MVMGRMVFRSVSAMVFAGGAWASSAFASDQRTNIYGNLTIWYAAHSDSFPVDAARDALNEALAPYVTIDLKTLDIMQVKSEYIESFDSWRDVIEGGIVAHRIDTVKDLTADVRVCYVFEENSSLVKEVFTFSDDMQIESLTSEELARECEAF